MGTYQGNGSLEKRVDRNRKKGRSWLKVFITALLGFGIGLGGYFVAKTIYPPLETPVIIDPELEQDSGIVDGELDLDTSTDGGLDSSADGI